MTAQRRPLEATLTPDCVTKAISDLNSASWCAARAEGCHAATGHFGAGNISNVLRYMGKAAHHLGLMLISPRNSEARVIDLEAGLAAALAREAALRDLLNERDGGNHDADCKALRATGPKLCNCGHDAVVAALAVKP